jgi:hypothetical protein
MYYISTSHFILNTMPFLMQSLEPLYEHYTPQNKRDHEFPYSKFPPLACLRHYCNTTDLLLIKANELDGLLNTLLSEFTRFQRRSAHQAHINQISDAIERDLFMLIEELESFSEASKLERKVSSLEPIVVARLQEFLKLKHTANLIKKVPRQLMLFVDEALAVEPCSKEINLYSTQDLARDEHYPPPFFAEDVLVTEPSSKRIKLSSDHDVRVGERLIEAIFSENRAQVVSLLSANPHLACYKNERGTVLGEAAWQSDLQILKTVLRYLPLDYNHAAIEGPAQLPAVLWAARTGQFNNFTYMMEIPSIKNTVCVRDIKKVINEIEELLLNFDEDPNDLNIKKRPIADYQMILTSLRIQYDLATQAVLPALLQAPFVFNPSPDH